MSRGLRYGKKIGTLEVKLDRKKDRYTRASVTTELRLDLSTGRFAAPWEGNWYTAESKKDLSEQIKKVATKALSLTWRRYLQVDYAAEAYPIDDPATGRPRTSGGNYKNLHLGDDRSALAADGPEDDSYAICEIKLRWSVCEISDPYPLPEDPKKMIRAQRDVETHAWGPDKGSEYIEDPTEWDDDVLPPGTLLWTPEREALLREVLQAFGRLDQRLVDLFSGDAALLAAKIDAATLTDPGRLLAAPTRPDALPPKKRRSS